jgi:hypothetical protein
VPGRGQGAAERHSGRRPLASQIIQTGRLSIRSLAAAKSISHPAHKVAILEMAQAWLKLAEKADKKPGVIYESQPA